VAARAGGLQPPLVRWLARSAVVRPPYKHAVIQGEGQCPTTALPAAAE
jgi:hypothetical protein